MILKEEILLRLYRRGDRKILYDGNRKVTGRDLAKPSPIKQTLSGLDAEIGGKSWMGN